MSYSAAERYMKCPNCTVEMKSMAVEGHLSPPVTIDLCQTCQAFWFDKYESLKLSPASTLKLMQLIGERSTTAKPPLAGVLPCPRCPSRLVLTHDLQRNTRFSYWRCVNGHGRFIGFLEFLKEKTLSAL